MQSLNKKVASIGATFDYFFGDYYKPLIFFAIFLSFVFYCAFSINNALSWDGWSTGDWLINFSSGFVRRGILGEIIIQTSSLLGSKINYLTSAIQILCYFVFCSTLVRIILQKRITFWYFFWFTYPASIAFFIFDPAAVGRKEVLLFAFFSYWIVHLETTQSNSILKKVSLGTISIFLTLSHELFLFFSGYFVFAAYLSNCKNACQIQTSLLIPSMSFLTVCIVFYVGGPINQPEICNRLISLGADQNVCRGILAWKETQISHTLSNFVLDFSWKTAVGFFLIPAVVITPALTLLSNQSKEKRQSFIKFSGSLVALSIPLFFVAIDWGRWVNIHAILLILCASFLLKNMNEKIELTGLKKMSKFVFFSNFLLSFTILASSVFWMVRHCCRYAFFEPRFIPFY